MSAEEAWKMMQEDEECEGDDGSQGGRCTAMSAVEAFELIHS